MGRKRVSELGCTTRGISLSGELDGRVRKRATVEGRPISAIVVEGIELYLALVETSRPGQTPGAEVGRGHSKS